MRIRSNHWINRQRDMVNGVQSCELDLTVPQLLLQAQKHKPRKRLKSSTFGQTKNHLSDKISFINRWYLIWCRWPDSNRHALMRRGILSPMRLPFRHTGNRSIIARGMRPHKERVADIEPKISTSKEAHVHQHEPHSLYRALHLFELPLPTFKTRVEEVQAHKDFAQAQQPGHGQAHVEHVDRQQRE